MNVIEFTHELARELGTRGVTALESFVAPGNRAVEFDLFLPGHPRAVVEVRRGSEGLDRVRADVVRRTRSAEGIFGGPPIVFLVITKATEREADGFADAVGGYVPTLHVIARPGAGELPPATAADAIKAALDAGVRGRRRAAKPIKPPGLPASELAGVTRSILTALNGAIPPAEYTVIEDELRMLHREHDAQHFTACALRAGRTLECVVYALARAWAVPVNEPLLRTLASLGDGLKELNRRVLGFFDKPAEERKAEKLELVDAANDFSAKLHRMLAGLGEGDPPPTTGASPPRNLGAILGDIRRRYIKLAAVRREIDAIRGPHLEAILRLRNAAAHAGPDGLPREVTREQVESMFGSIHEVLFRLTNVDEEILAPLWPRSDSIEGPRGLKADYGWNRTYGFFVRLFQEGLKVDEYHELAEGYNHEQPKAGALEFFMRHGFFDRSDLIQAPGALGNLTADEVEAGGLRTCMTILTSLRRAAD